MPPPVGIVELDSHKGLGGVDTSFQNVGETFPRVTLLTHDYRPAIYNVRIFSSEGTHPRSLLQSGQKLSKTTTVIVPRDAKRT